MHDLQSLEQRIAALEQRLAALEMGRDAQQHNAPALALATEEELDDLARTHTGLALLPLLDHLDVQYPAVVGMPLPLAKEVLFNALIDDALPVFATTAQTRLARNGSFYLSVSFGFGACAVFNNDIDRVFRDTGYLMLDWQRDGYALTFDPPLSAILGRDGRGYPRILNMQAPIDPILYPSASNDDYAEVL
jgi:hypothetical protein